MIDFLNSFGNLPMRVNTLSPEGRCLDIYQDIALKFPDEVIEVLDTIEEKKQEYRGLKIKCELGFYYYLPESYKLFKEKNQEPKEAKHLKSGCGAAPTSCVIDAAGDVIPCEGFPMFAGGNIRSRDLMEIWNNSETFNKIRELSNITMDRVPYCMNCDYNLFCNAGCRANAYAVHGDLLAPDPLCPFWREK